MMNEINDGKDVLLVGGGAGGLVALAYSATRFLRRWNRDVAENTKDRAEGNLYEQLSTQVAEYRKVADDAFKERNALVGRVATLEAQVAMLAPLQELNDRLKGKLDQRDEQHEHLVHTYTEERRQYLELLRNKDVELSKRDESIRELTKAVNELQIRLVNDESKIAAFNCPLAAHNAAITPPGSHDPAE